MELQSDSSNRYHVETVNDNQHQNLDMRKTEPVPHVQNNPGKNKANGHATETFQYENLAATTLQKMPLAGPNTDKKSNDASTHLAGALDFQRKAEEDDDGEKYGIDYYLARERLEKRLGVGCFNFNDIKQELSAMQSEENSHLEFKRRPLDEVADEMTEDKHEVNSGVVLTFGPKLPEEKYEEFQRICFLHLSAVNDAGKKVVLDMMKKVSSNQKTSLRNRFTEVKSEAVAYVSKAVPLVRDGNVFIPADETQFDRVNTQSGRQWPLLVKDGEKVDTMFAHRADAEEKRWEYFIITRDGAKVKCSK